MQSLNDFPEQVLLSVLFTNMRLNMALGLTDGDPTVIVIGAGHSGLEVAARLKYFGVPHFVIDKKARVGDNWRDRYNTLYLHTTIYVGDFELSRYHSRHLAEHIKAMEAGILERSEVKF